MLMNGCSQCAPAAQLQHSTMLPAARSLPRPLQSRLPPAVNTCARIVLKGQPCLDTNAEAKLQQKGSQRSGSQCACNASLIAQSVVWRRSARGQAVGMRAVTCTRTCCAISIKHSGQIVRQSATALCVSHLPKPVAPAKAEEHAAGPRSAAYENEHQWESAKRGLWPDSTMHGHTCLLGNSCR